nr:MAG TPA: hypothetical protein [Caudoviricetes sp.]
MVEESNTPIKTSNIPILPTARYHTLGPTIPDRA